MLLNNSRYKEFAECERKHAWRRVFKLDLPGQANALSFGQAIHEGLATLYTGGTQTQVVQTFLDTYEREGNPLDIDIYGPHKKMGAKLLDSYINRDYVLDDFSVSQVESRFAVILGEGCYNCGAPYKDKEYKPDYTKCHRCGMPIFGLAGQADLVTTRNDRFNIIDHKTATGVGKSYLAGWGHDFGMIGYCYGVSKLLGHSITRFGMNIIKKVTTMDKTTKACPDCRNGKHKKMTCDTCVHTGIVPTEPVKAFYREYYRVTPQDYRNLIDNRIALGARMYHHRLAFEDPKEVGLAKWDLYPMNTATCHKYGSECPYVSLCWSSPPDVPWWQPPDVLLSQYEDAPNDYIDQLVKEELK